MRVRAGSMLLVVAVLLGLPHAASATTAGWSIQQDAIGDGRGILRSVSCTSPTACTAVGYVVGPDSARPMTLAERWNGKTWSVQATPNPTSDSQLLSVSCTPETHGWRPACIAVGYSWARGQGQQPLIERWDGTSWSVRQSPTTLGTSGLLFGVSCTSAIACTAVGHITNDGVGYQTLAERWNGVVWETQPTVSPTPDSHFRSVSCTSVSACTAVGSSGAEPLAERWDGATWTTQPLNGPAMLRGVSCSSESDCTAVGQLYNPGDFSSGVVLVEHWNGKEWEPQPAPRPTQPSSVLMGVSCLASWGCTAVGSSYDETTCSTSCVDAPLAEHSDGTDWVIQPTPNPTGGTENWLEGVSCPTPSLCVAVGGVTSTPLIERWAPGPIVLGRPGQISDGSVSSTASS